MQRKMSRSLAKIPTGMIPATVRNQGTLLDLIELTETFQDMLIYVTISNYLFSTCSKAYLWISQTAPCQCWDTAVIWLKARPDGCRLIKLMRPSGGPADQISAKTLLTRLMH